MINFTTSGFNLNSDAYEDWLLLRELTQYGLKGMISTASLLQERCDFQMIYRLVIALKTRVILKYLGTKLVR